MDIKMFSSIFTKIKIFNAIIKFIAINMVNNFRRFYMATYLFFHNKISVLYIATLHHVGVVWHKQVKIPLHNPFSIFDSIFLSFIPRNLSVFKFSSRRKMLSFFNCIYWDYPSFCTFFGRRFSFKLFPITFVRAIFSVFMAKLNIKTFFANLTDFFNFRLFCKSTIFSTFSHNILQIKKASFSVAYEKWLHFKTLTKSLILAIKNPLLISIFIITFLFGMSSGFMWQ